jgi:hypothetical protein
MTAAKSQRLKEPQSPPPTHSHYWPSHRKKKRKKNRRKKLHQFHVICNKVETTAENERSQTYKWRERSRAQLRYSEDFL